MGSFGSLLSFPVAGRGAPRARGAGPATILAALILACPHAKAGLPIANQVPLMLKLLTYESRLMSMPIDTIRVGVIYAPKNEASSRCFQEFSSEAGRYADFTVHGRRVLIRPIALKKGGRIDWPGAGSPIEVLYVAPGVEEHLGQITTFTRNAKVLSVTGVDEFVRRGVTAGILLTEDRPGITLNMSASQQEGCEWETNLLQICQLIR